MRSILKKSLSSIVIIFMITLMILSFNHTLAYGEDETQPSETSGIIEGINGGPGVSYKPVSDQSDTTQISENNTEASSTENNTASEVAASEAAVSQTTLKDNLKAEYAIFSYGYGWSDSVSDNTSLRKVGTYPTAFKANLTGDMPQGTTGTIQYQVNLSGSGWLDWTENGQQTGDTVNSAPLEAIRVRFNGNLADTHDIYTKVFVSNAWTSWVKNGETAGQEGVGLRIEGVRIAVTAKGAGEPESYSLDVSKPMIALTFDDGPNASTTNRILAALEAAGGRATFFMVGNRVSGANAVSVARMVADGNEVGNHTYAHTYLTGMSETGIRQSISAANTAIEAASGVKPTLVRPPGGYYNSASNAVLASMGMTDIMWSLDTKDWKTRNTQSTVSAVLNNVRAGDIVLMHDIYVPSAAAAEIIIPELVARGYQLVTVSELSAARGGLSAGGVYFAFH